MEGLKVDRYSLSPNRYLRWLYGRPYAVIIHSTRSGREDFTDDQELEATLSWFSKPESNASAHLVISSSQIVRVVDDAHAAWHAGQHNYYAYGIELTQPTIDRPYTDGHYALLARACAHYLSLGVPLIHLPRYDSGQRGFVGHDQTVQGKRSGKTDPGPQFDWDRFIRMVEAELTEEEEMSSQEYQQLSKRLNDVARWQGAVIRDLSERVRELVRRQDGDDAANAFQNQVIVELARRLRELESG